MSQRCNEWKKLSHEERYLIENLQTSAPVKLGPIADALGVAVKVTTLPANISGEIRRSAGVSKSGFTIRINKHERKERQRFTLAHEIAHFLLHRDLIKEELSDDVLYRSTLSNSREAEANRLASDILMPFNLVEEVLRDVGDKPESVVITVLAEKLGVSDAAAKIRLSQ
jgi:Zn-dependent peptidase ImmA (M78 family)